MATRKGMVAVVARESSDYTYFWTDLSNLKRPPGTVIAPIVGGPLGTSRQIMVEQMLEGGYDYIVFLDSDHVVPSDWLLRLLARPVVPILGSLYLKRDPPFMPIVYTEPDDQQMFGQVGLLELPTSGVTPVYAVGTSGLMIQREVFERLPSPWFELADGEKMGEDMRFCHHAQQAGIPVMLDVESRLEHWTPCAVGADVMDGQWVTVLRRNWLKIPMEPVTRPEDYAHTLGLG